MQVRFKKAPHKGAFFVCLYLCLYLFSADKLYASGCEAKRINEYVKIVYVYDGDTVKLSDGRKLRIIGIDTPEMGRDKKPNEPFAEKARQHLITLIGNSRRLGIEYDQERKDKYGRFLVHVYNAQGVNVAANMLGKGFATLMPIPPNILHINCYRDQEVAARERLLGLWQLAKYKQIEPLKLNSTGYHSVRGVITDVINTKSSVRLALGADFIVRIRKPDLQYFKGLDFGAVKGKTLIVRGKVYRSKRGWFMQLRHMSAMEWVN